ncbi:ABC-type transport auxiliary lipoprotein family protein [Acuticoccus sp. MNP-M23]|uniref:ABC-type transport auxiliary lipoprotein family protein n=1 Tax=Acuticoccus sp. MNP-M23 TaxID=3072793 RepID=UPI002814DC73|nr:ABC-type transport auxiliary lipoprotein family protein [Acuticoccus sp. MNP-M23]WMS41208.1 ABC-type transport auxiliary lipoprotein family protein [Acuticoccus sp. MNP-M23]
MTRILSIFLIAALAGCSGGGSNIEAIYTINALESVPSSRGTTAQLLVPEPRALESLSSSRIPVKPTASTLSYYPAVALEDSAPKVIQRVLLDTFQNTGRVKAVGLPGQSLLINYQVVTEVRAFQAETFGVDVARVELTAKILNDSNGRVVADRIFVTVVPMSGDSAGSAADGLNRASQALAADVVAWTLATI